MTSSLKATLLVSSIAAIALFAAPAAVARYHDRGDRPVDFASDSGGYCDRAGCPDHFWRLPIHYGAVFFAGRWFRGPVYFRGDWRNRQYWVQGGWHRDEWHGRRPSWAGGHDGPPQPFEFYIGHGFRLGDQWRHLHDEDNGGGQHDWNGGDRHDHGDNGGRDDRGGHGGPGEWHGGDNNGQGGDHGRNADNGHGGDRNGQMPADNTIRVTAATYGGTTCHQATGNVTKFLADACNGKKSCDYVVQYQVIGDPAPGCAKDFAVQWTCSAGGAGTANAAAEAGLGSHVALQCTNPGH